MIENFRPGLLESSATTCCRPRTRLVMVRLSGYGQTGPYRDRPGFGAIAESMGGLRHITGYPELPPPRIGISIGDSIAALHGVIGALMALHHRKVNGGAGQVVDVALYEAVFNMMESVVPEYGVYGMVRERTGASLPGIVPSNTYACRDGSIVIGGNSDPIFKRLMKAIERDDLADDPALAQTTARAAHAGDRRRDCRVACAAHDRRSTRRAQRGRRAGRAHLQRRRHVRSAVRRAADDPALQVGRRHRHPAAEHHAEAVRHAGRNALARPNSASIRTRCCAASAMTRRRLPHCAKRARFEQPPGLSLRAGFPELGIAQRRPLAGKTRAAQRFPEHAERRTATRRRGVRCPRPPIRSRRTVALAPSFLGYNRRMRILLSNDDGYLAPVSRAQRRAAAAGRAR